METITDFIFLGSKITAGGDCSQEIKRPLLLRRKAMTSLLLSRFSRVRLSCLKATLCVFTIFFLPVSTPSGFI